MLWARRMPRKCCLWRTLLSTSSQPCVMYSVARSVFNHYNRVRSNLSQLSESEAASAWNESSSDECQSFKLHQASAYPYSR